MDDVLGELHDWAACHPPPLLQHVEVAGDPPGEWQLLLDQQDRQPRLAIQLQDDVADVVDDVRLDSFGGFVQDEQLRLEHEGARDRKLLLLPARQVAAAPLQHLLQHREEVEDLRRNHPPPAPRAETGAQVLLHRQLREDLASLRHVADAEPCARFGRHLRQLDAIERDRARVRREQPHDALQQGGLAHAVAPHQARPRARGDVQPDVPEDVAAAVLLVEPLDRQHTHAPR